MGAVELGELVRHALRLRPDRIVVGEVRGAEAVDMIQAMATGHPGSMSTMHATDAGDALWRLELLSLAGEPGLSPQSVRSLIQAAIDIVVVMERRAGQRRIRSVAAVAAHGLEELA